MSAPTTYRQPVSRLWWMKKRTYFVFVMRELSSVFVAWFAVFLMVMVVAIGRGEAVLSELPELGRLTSRRCGERRGTGVSWCCTP